MIRIFPKEFIFGAAISAFQVEGVSAENGRITCCWDDVIKQYSDDMKNVIASDFCHNYEKDIERCREYNIQTLEISIAWTRIISDENGTANEAGIKYYSNIIDTCIMNGIQPFVALYHFDTPIFFFEKGDWLNENTTKQFIHYAKICFERFGDRVCKWITIKDPYSMAIGQYVTGIFPPKRHYEIDTAIQVMHKMMVAHSYVVRLYKQLYPNGEIGIAHRLESVYPFSDSDRDCAAAEFEDILANQFILEATLLGQYESKTLDKINEITINSKKKFSPKKAEIDIMKYAAQNIDFLGINYYTSHFVEHYEDKNIVIHNSTGKKGSSLFALKGIGKHVQKEDVPSTDWDWSIFPNGLYDMLIRIGNNYPYKKIYITENGMGLHEQIDGHEICDEKRIDYIRQHLNAILNAMDKGINVQGYFIWSLIDAFSWANGYEKRYGLFFVDYNTQKRYPKQSVQWYKNLGEKRIMLTANAINPYQ